MTIIYSVVCRAKDAAILVEVCDKDVKGTFGTIMVELLQHMRDHPDFFADGDLKTFVQRNSVETDFFSHFLEACSAAALGNDNEAPNDTDNHFFHLYLKNNVYYCCLSDDADTRDQKVYVHSVVSPLLCNLSLSDKNTAILSRTGQKFCIFNEY